MIDCDELEWQLGSSKWLQLAVGFVMDIGVDCTRWTFADVSSQEASEVLDVVVGSKSLITFVVAGMVGSIVNCFEKTFVTGVGYA